MLTLSMMQLLWPQNNQQPRLPEARLLEGIAKAAPAVFPKYGLDNDLLVAHAMSQFSHECGGGRSMVESIQYTPQRAAEVWPGRFSSAADCEAKVGCRGTDPKFPTRLIDMVYGDRNGNRPGTSDGSTYIGRGLAQVTGRGNYEKLGTLLNLNLVDNPALVNEPDKALECGVAMFILRGCLEPARAGNVKLVTKKLNGGDVGLLDRIAKLDLWKNALLQQALNRLGANPVLATDGVFGKKSIEALMSFQRKKGLEATGRADDAKTLAAVDAAIAAIAAPPAG